MRRERRRYDGATSTCNCAGVGVWLPGEGGCAPTPGPSEDLCDSTGGGWTDDDANLSDTFCDCGVHRTWQDGTGCTAI